MMALIVGLIIGFVMCVPIGPINVWVINTHLKKSSLRALSIALGGSIMDIAYFYIILSGLSFLSFNQTMTFYFKMVGIVLIFILGIKELLSKTIAIDEDTKRESPKSLLSGILLGIIIYTSNPTLILTMSGLGAFVKSLEIFVFDQFNIILVSIGLGVGSFLWFVFLVKVVDRYKEAIRNKYLIHFTRISGGLMIGLSFYMGHSLYSR